MTAIEQRERTLDELETVIERGKQTFVEVGLALMEVRDRRLYKDAGFATFEKYCIGRWNFTRQRAHQLVDAAKVVEVLAGNTSNNLTFPEKPTHASELAPLARQDPQQAREVWADVVEESEETGQPITAKKVRAAVQRTTRTNSSFNLPRPSPREVVNKQTGEILNVDDLEVIPVSDEDREFIGYLQQAVPLLERAYRMECNRHCLTIRASASRIRDIIKMIEEGDVNSIPY